MTITYRITLTHEQIVDAMTAVQSDINACRRLQGSTESGELSERIERMEALYHLLVEAEAEESE